MVAERLVILEAKKMPEQKAKEDELFKEQWNLSDMVDQEDKDDERDT